MKKLLSVLLVLTLLLSCAVISASAVPDSPFFVVTGAPCELFGTTWDKNNRDNLMEYQGGHTYAKTFTADSAYSEVQVKIYDSEADEWYGDESGYPLIFEITRAGEFTIFYDTLNHVADVAGDNVFDPGSVIPYEEFYVFGNGDDGWLNGAADNAIILQNEMEQIAEDLFCLRLANTKKGTAREFRFSYLGDKEWNFGGVYQTDGVWTDAVFQYEGAPVTFDVDEVCEVYLFLDMRGFDFATKEGARFGVVMRRDGDRFHLPAEPSAEPVCGDVSFDGRLGIDDVTLVQRALAEFSVLGDIRTLLADYDMDGVVSIADVTALQRIIAEFR